MNKNLLENDKLPASELMYQELFGERDREDIDQKQGVEFKQTSSVVSKKTTTGIQNVIMAGVLFLNPSGHAEEPKLVVSVENKPVPASVEVATNDTKLASLSVNTVDHSKRIKEFVDSQELLDYCKNEVLNMNAEEKEIAKQQFNILNLTAMLSPMKKEEIKTWCLNPDNAWAKKEPYKTIVTAQYNSAESSVGVEGEPNIAKTVVAVGQNVALNENAENRRKKLEEERLRKVRTEILTEMNREINKANSWISLLPGQDGNDSVVKAQNSNGGIRFSIDKNKKKGQITYRKELPAGPYVVKTGATGMGKIGIWWKGGKEVPLTDKQSVNFVLKEPTEVDIYVKLTLIGTDVVIDDFQIAESSEIEIAQGVK